MTTTAVSQNLLDSFVELHDQLASETVEREREIHGALLALVTGTHVFYYGPPGLAKSYLVDRLVLRVEGLNHQHLLLNNFTSLNEMFGALDIQALKSGHNVRKTELHLPWAHTAFYDEIWKCNDSALNALLAALNERRYAQDGQWLPMPLSTMFCASNELPANESLTAIYDRIPQRYELSSIQEPGNFITMLQTNVEDEVDPVLSWDEISRAIKEVKAIGFDPKVHDLMAEIRRDLFKKEIQPSDRRFKQSLRILQGEAWLDGCDVVAPEHLGVLVNVLWDQPTQQHEVQTVVLEHANPLEKELLTILSDIGQVNNTVQKALSATDDDEKQAIGMEAHQKIVKLAQELQKLKKQASQSRRQQGHFTKANDALHTISEILLDDVFQANDKAAS